MARKINSRIKELRRESGPTSTTAGGLLRKTMYFTREEWDAVRRLAYEANITYAEIVRRALQEYLGLPKQRQKRGPRTG